MVSYKKTGETISHKRLQSLCLCACARMCAKGCAYLSIEATLTSKVASMTFFLEVIKGNISGL